MYWSRLRELFNLINSGDDFLHIPPYNGRLFDDQKEHQSLAAWKVGDSYLAEAIDQLARARAAGRTGRGFVSYRDLSIRELGSIYEGLLKHRPRYATQDMAVVREDNREMFIPLAELGSRKALKVYAAGSVYLETDKGERKATGSYYTPDYIVKYIVDSTVGPILEEAENSDGNLIDSILSLKVLDPAMGSGHFLVEATDFLARALVEALGGDPQGDGGRRGTLGPPRGSRALHIWSGPEPIGCGPGQALALAFYRLSGQAAELPRPPSALR